jgi:Zn finger protein HypA/HybF involved in hydrogenase expression
MADFKEFGEYLHCPHCKSEYMHLRDVRIMTRNLEGKDDGLCLNVNVEKGICWFKTKVTDECKSNQDETSLTFWCELCGKDSTITFEQAKGLTSIR